MLTWQEQCFVCAAPHPPSHLFWKLYRMIKIQGKGNCKGIKAIVYKIADCKASICSCLNAAILKQFISTPNTGIDKGLKTNVSFFIENIWIFWKGSNTTDHNVLLNELIKSKSKLMRETSPFKDCPHSNSWIYIASTEICDTIIIRIGEMKCYSTILAGQENIINLPQVGDLTPDLSECSNIKLSNFHLLTSIYLT